MSLYLSIILYLYLLQAAWMLLSEFVPYTKSMDVDFLSKSWQSHVSSVDLAQGGVWEERVLFCGRGYCFVGGWEEVCRVC